MKLVIALILFLPHLAWANKRLDLRGETCTTALKSRPPIPVRRVKTDDDPLIAIREFLSSLESGRMGAPNALYARYLMLLDILKAPKEFKQELDTIGFAKNDFYKSLSLDSAARRVVLGWRVFQRAMGDPLMGQEITVAAVQKTVGLFIKLNPDRDFAADPALGIDLLTKMAIRDFLKSLDPSPMGEPNGLYDRYVMLLKIVAASRYEANWCLSSLSKIGFFPNDYVESGRPDQPGAVVRLALGWRAFQRAVGDPDVGKPITTTAVKATIALFKNLAPTAIAAGDPAMQLDRPTVLVIREFLRSADSKPISAPNSIADRFLTLIERVIATQPNMASSATLLQDLDQIPFKPQDYATSLTIPDGPSPLRLARGWRVFQRALEDPSVTEPITVESVMKTINIYRAQVKVEFADPDIASAQTSVAQSEIIADDALVEISDFLRRLSPTSFATPFEMTSRLATLLFVIERENGVQVGFESRLEDIGFEAYDLRNLVANPSRKLRLRVVKAWRLIEEALGQSTTEPLTLSSVRNSEKLLTPTF